MSESPRTDLSALTLDDAQALDGDTFVRVNEGGPDIRLRLVEVERAQQDPTAEASPSGRPFTLLFRGPADPRLTQGIHDLDHPHHALAGLFLVPVGEDADGVLYEAVFA